MRNLVFLALVAGLSVLASGCAIVSKHKAPVSGGTQTTVGLIGIPSVGDGYPMLPLYMSFDAAK